MKLIKTFVALALVVVLTSAASAPKQKGGVYIFGVSSSFTDTVAYFSAIQYLDTIELKKGGVLPFLPNYSSQLENYIEVMKEKPNQTSATFYFTSKKKAEKDRTKLINRYKKKMGHEVEFIPAEEFTYSPVEPD